MFFYILFIPSSFLFCLFVCCFFYYQDIVNYKKRHGNDTILSLKFIPKLYCIRIRIEIHFNKYTKYINIYLNSKTIWARGISFLFVLIYNILVIQNYILENAKSLKLLAFLLSSTDNWNYVKHFTDL